MREGGGLSAWHLSRLLRPPRRPGIANQPTAKPRSQDALILSWACRYKLFTVGQVQRRFSQSPRTAYRTVTRLRSLQLIKPAVVRNVSPLWPVCYQVTPRGIRHLADELTRSGRPVPADLTPARWKSRGIVVSTALHDLCVTEFGIALELTVGERSDIELLHTERGYPNNRQKRRRKVEAQSGVIAPDAGFITATVDPDKPPALTLTWLEIDLSTESNRVILDKLYRYHRYARSDLGQQQIKSLYHRFGPGYRHHAWRIAVVVHDPINDHHDDRRLASFVSQALLLPASTRHRIWLTTAADLRRTVHHRQPLGHPVWIKVYDLRSAVSAFRKFAGPADTARRPEPRNRQYVEDLLTSLPRHQLFPRATAGLQRREPMSAGTQPQKQAERVSQTP